MKAREAIIAWTSVHREGHPTAGQVKVGPFVKEGDVDWIKPYASFAGAACRDRRDLRGDKGALMVFVDFHTLVVREGIAPEVAHGEFLKIDEYRELISPDIPGAD
ncbi:hypothetical protein N8D56_04915 [Devosia sp. A8/3-2]|nr:hypothetical protein N8D56_04915 [Devosia sp. A8/3-2]